MSELEEKLGTILNNPQMMQQIMSLAQSMGPQAPPKQEESRPAASSLPDIDPGMLQKLSGLARQGGIDREQLALLSALGPYLSRDRISRLERAMRAAKMARMASSLLGPGGMLSQSGR